MSDSPLHQETPDDETADEETPAEHIRPVIVVAIDGSPPSSRALKWAAEEARFRGADLRVVRAWNVPVYSVGFAGLPEGVFEDAPTIAAQDMDEQIAAVLSAEPSVPIERVIEYGQAAHVILDAAKGADLVVLGSRGRGGFSGLFLGSVSTQVLHHAKCPTLVVR
jgi:nucleotide-binding universal stress UspA family protein